MRRGQGGGSGGVQFLVALLFVAGIITAFVVTLKTTTISSTSSPSPCAKCPAGYYIKTECTATVGTVCLPCTVCPMNESIFVPCSNSSDTVCGNVLSLFDFLYDAETLIGQPSGSAVTSWPDAIHTSQVLTPVAGSTAPIFQSSVVLNGSSMGPAVEFNATSLLGLFSGPGPAYTNGEPITIFLIVSTQSGTAQNPTIVGNAPSGTTQGWSLGVDYGNDRYCFDSVNTSFVCFQTTWQSSFALVEVTYGLVTPV